MPKTLQPGDAEQPNTRLDVIARLGVLSCILMLISGFAWMQYTLITGAVIASGQVLVRGAPKQVQNLDGGVVDRIFVEDGDLVKAGDVMMRLDSSLLQINLDIFRNRLAEILTREARLMSEQGGLDEPEFVFSEKETEGLDLEQHFAGQREIFVARREVLEGRKEQLAERIRQFRNQISGVEAQITAGQEQLSFVEQELDSQRKLQNQGLARESQVLELQGRQSALLGQVAEHQSELARIENSIRDTQLEILQAEREFKEQVVTELRETTAEREELQLQIVTAEKQLERIDILAPADGVVHEMQVTTEGGIVSPEVTIAEVVPVSDGVEFELRVAPDAIDQVYLGQPAKVIFPAFNLRITPEIFGSVAGISPTSVTEQATGESYFRVDLDLPEEEIGKLGPVELIPGMPVEAFLQTNERSVLQYLTKPLTDQLDRAFRE
ncbi:MAG: HlyD family type I secretion periplasmic adaptor subunit [Pseudomonadota bacterium]